MPPAHRSADPALLGDPRDDALQLVEAPGQRVVLLGQPVETADSFGIPLPQLTAETYDLSGRRIASTRQARVDVTPRPRPWPSPRRPRATCRTCACCG
ncbi:hypothetical protein ACFV27_21195 [Streptomyces antimycoticus]|uniref:Uncharacterized protein n=1 Tax=Streptomyces antimycoticus TaxID=68175 RepID=A0ABD5JKL4_9ACTN|nr:MULTISPECIES: hypothetical protein [Streptomyces]MEE4588183.1 hypothetical protein [Streptomyces sp. DSM 41602]WJD94706.1 hypothetical protein QR300_00950 [Streptomyces antimycoticus]WTA86572.1 hypothetical protein OG751_45865 [Streptomyces antimycoticus]WTB11024.1 hypothetical protein OG546_47140 [Streptomyces antimycoticus]